MTQPSTRTIVKVAIALFALFLGIYYWPAAAQFLGLLLAAFVPLLLGLCLAYPLNILMNFYERHFSPTAVKMLCSNYDPACALYYQY